MSGTLKHILSHWKSDLPKEDPSTIKLPFNIELFCGENDNKIKELESALEDCLKIVRVFPPVRDVEHKAKAFIIEKAEKALGSK